MLESKVPVAWVERGTETPSKVKPVLLGLKGSLPSSSVRRNVFLVTLGLALVTVSMIAVTE